MSCFLILRCVFILQLLFSSLLCIPIDNGIVGVPSVQCLPDKLSVTFVTQRPFEGRVYSEGFASVSSCVGQGRSGVAPNITLSFSQCGVRRSRLLNPSGISIYTTIVVSFHQTFITKVDRSYRIACFYSEAIKTVGAALDVSMLTTDTIISRLTTPTCRYEILGGGPYGAPVRYARVGDPVYHKWTCEAKDDYSFCMRVHSCQVDDGQGGEPFRVLDSKGCSTDRYVMQNLEYISDLMAGREAHVFKFADKPTLYFNCQIELTLKSSDNAECKRPDCSNRTRGDTTDSGGENKVQVGIHDSGDRQRRNDKSTLSTDKTHFGNFDLPRQRLTILDIDDQNNDSRVNAYRTSDNVEHLFEPPKFYVDQIQNQVCMHRQIFGSLVIGFILTLTITILTCVKCAILKRNAKIV